MRLIPIFLVFSLCSSAQSITTEFDKNRDFSRYKTFYVAGGEIITPKEEQQVKSSSLKKWVTDAINEELKEKGLQQSDTTADLIATYAIGSDSRSDLESLGPGGMMPNSSDRTWSSNYRMGSIIIDLNDRSNNLVWRINGTTRDAADGKQLIEQVVSAGFKKFSLKPKKVKKK